MKKTSGHRAAVIAVWALVVCYAVLFSWLSLTRHWALGTLAYDLGNVNQAFWNTVHGRPLYFTNWRGVELNLATDNRLAMHVEPIYLLLAPVYWLWQRPETILVLQTVILALGAWPVYWLARERLESELAGVAFAAVYLLFPGLEAANLWEFHAVALAAPLLLFAFYYGQARRWGLFWLFALLAMATKEEVPLTAALIGLYLALRGFLAGARLPGVEAPAGRTGDPGNRRQPRGREDGWRARLRRPAVLHGAALVGVAALWFAVAVFVVVPHFQGSGSPYLKYYSDMGEGAGGIAKAALADPVGTLKKLLAARNLLYLRDLYTPVGFLSLLSPLTMAFSAPDLLINLLSDHEPMHFVEKYHYVAPLLPGIMISAVLGASWLARQATRLLRTRVAWSALILTAGVLILTGYYHHYHGYTPLARAFAPYEVTAHDRLVEEIAREIPGDAAVSAQPNLNPHVSGRKTLYRFPYIGDAEYILVDVSTLENVSSQYDLIQKLLRGGEFGLVRAQDGYLLLRRGAATSALPASFYDFAKATQVEAPQYPAAIDFGDAVRLVGFDVSYPRRTEMPDTPLRFLLYFQPLRPITEELQFALYLLDGQRQVLGSTDVGMKAGVQYWYPTTRWQPGETIKIEFAGMPWWTAQYHEYSVAVGVVRGDDAWDVAARVRPTVGPLSSALPYAGDRTLVDLQGFRTDPGGMPDPVPHARLAHLPARATPFAAAWQNGIELLGFELPSGPARPGETLTPLFYWRATGPLAQDYTVFVHLVQEGPPPAQHDAMPDLGGFPTSEWQPGEIVPDRHPVVLPADLPSGAYRIVVGLYDPNTRDRLRLGDGSDAVTLPVGVNVAAR